MQMRGKLLRRCACKPYLGSPLGLSSERRRRAGKPSVKMAAAEYVAYAFLMNVPPPFKLDSDLGLMKIWECETIRCPGHVPAEFTRRFRVSRRTFGCSLFSGDCGARALRRLTLSDAWQSYLSPPLPVVNEIMDASLRNC